MVFIYFIIAFIFLWLIIGTIYFIRMYRQYNMLSKGVTDKSLTEILNTVLVTQKASDRAIAEIRKTVTSLIQAQEKDLQRVGVVRFNPFSDTGGNQSFTIALLDAADSGIVMTSLYARTGNRWYIKQVKNAVGIEVELSREEKAAIREAKRV